MVFNVQVDDDTGRSRHRVTLQPAFYEKIRGADATAAQCIEAAFRFLLSRESRSDILPSFDLNVILLYFPDFETELPRFIEDLRKIR